jgi:hypothetical protein
MASLDTYKQYNNGIITLSSQNFSDVRFSQLSLCILKSCGVRGHVAECTNPYLTSVGFPTSKGSKNAPGVGGFRLGGVRI